MPTLPRRLLLGLALAVAAVTLAGCTPAANSLAALEAYQRDRVDADALPDDLVTLFADSIDPESTRLLFEDDRVTLYAASAANEAEPMSGTSACLVVASDDPVAGCSGGMPLTMGVPGGAEYALSRRMPDDEGWTELADGVWTRER
ncbi:hypothetical protein [Herbiconiux sp. VKM Ac-2851]|uniref:hypothetical protein n=1 Tax=Herbiconiux sp. VKM Ac-2851 TaxID=2739025 RepID=UPI001563236B|nr:hypothetical protein [Herbiconiux sp. VKM Ac-2851]NQX36900.1 hypothetical protein [Herbiconiux sp. VKM Ac-2851]